MHVKLNHFKSSADFISLWARYFPIASHLTSLLKLILWTIFNLVLRRNERRLLSLLRIIHSIHQTNYTSFGSKSKFPKCLLLEPARPAVNLKSAKKKDNMIEE